MAKLYTRTGDRGSTGLLGPGRVPKDHVRIEAVGAVDELNSVLGVAIASQKDQRVRNVLLKIQDQLFTVGAELASVGPQRASKIPTISAAHVLRLESLMEDFDVGKVSEFILPRGSEALARLHWARAVTRRAERRAVALSRRSRVNPEILRYLNRLSSLLYTIALWVQKREGTRPEHPTYQGGRT